MIKALSPRTGFLFYRDMEKKMRMMMRRRMTVGSNSKAGISRIAIMCDPGSILAVSG